ncbi:MAG: 50S ribosomal protein L24 [Candidatus Diapherotrites archaeon]|nr:50S ribosomal protein L24 [Candidatus Diapherotrites archaeon]
MKLSTTQPRKQRKKTANLPVHQRKISVASHLSKDLRSELGIRSLTLRKGDVVKVMRGKFKGKEGKVATVNRSRSQIKIEGLVIKKSSGSEVPTNIKPSNVMITTIDRSDARRFKNKKLKTPVKVVKKPEPKKEAKEKKKEPEKKVDTKKKTPEKKEVKKE